MPPGGSAESVIFSRRDLDFLLYEWLDVTALTALTARERFAEHDRETFDALLDLAEEGATEHFYPHLRRSDLNEPTFDGERVHLIPEIAAAVDARHHQHAAELR
nr:acyl-CoA dehydrogenase N-terminal domain-containing protein [Pseudofrankia sp. DC12]